MSLPDFSCSDVLSISAAGVKLCAPNLFIYTGNEIERSSINFTETFCSRAKPSIWPIAEPQLEALAFVEVEGLNSRSLFS
jgi:hypothetical protein